MNVRKFLKDDILKILPPDKKVITDGNSLILVEISRNEWVSLLSVINFVKECNKNGCNS